MGGARQSGYEQRGQNWIELVVHHDVHDAPQKLGIVDAEHDQRKRHQSADNQADDSEHVRPLHRREINLLQGVPDQKAPLPSPDQPGAR